MGLLNFRKKKLEKVVESLMTENSELRNKLKKHEAKFKKTGESLDKQNKRLSELNKFSLKLAYLPYNEVFPFVVSQIKEIFGVKAAWITTYDESTSELVVQYSSLSDEENGKVLKLLGGKLLKRRTYVSENDYKRITNELYAKIASINELTFGAIPDIIGKPIEKLLGIDWFAALALVHNEKLVGTMIVVGDKNQSYPQKEEISAFAGIVANAIIRKEAEEKLFETEGRYQSIINSSPMGMHMYELQEGDRLVFAGANPAADKILGFEHKSIIGLTIEEAFPPLIETEVPSKYKEIIKKKTIWQTEQIDYKDDKVRGAFEVYAFRISDNQMVALFLEITKRKQMEIAVKESEEKYRTLFKNSALAVGLRAIDGTFIEFNDAYLRMLGYTFEDIIKLNQSDITHTDDLHITKSKMQLIAEGKSEVETYQKRYIHKSGNIVWGEVCIQPLKNAEGEVVAIIGTVSDITEKKKAEELLKQSEERWKFALEGAGDGVWDWNAKTNKVYFSDQWKKMLGYKVYEVGDDLEEWSKRVHPEDLKKCYEDLNKHFNGESEIYSNEHRMLCKNGEYKWILDRGKVVVRDEDGKPLRVIGTHHDLTERKIAENSIRESEENLSITLNSIGDGVISTDKKGLITKMNPVAEKLCGWQFKEAEGKPLEEVFNIVDATSKAKLKNPVEKVIKTGKVVELSNHTVLISKDGTERNISDSAAPILNKDNKIQGVVLVFSDVTEKYLAREAIKASELRANKQRKALTELATNEIISSGDIGKAKRLLTEIAADALGVERCSLWLMSKDNSEMKCIDLFESKKQKHSEGTIIQYDQCPVYFKEVTENSPLAVKDVINDLRTNQLAESYLIPLKIVSMLDAKVTSEDGGFGGVVCFEQTVKQREWYPDEESFASTIASYLIQILSIAGKKESDEALKRNEEILSDIFNSVNEGIAYTTLAGEVLSVNRALLEIVGVKEEEIVGKNVINIANRLLSGNVGKTVGSLLLDILKGNKVPNFEVSFNDKILDVGAFYNSKSKRITGVIRDITLQKNAEKELRESEERYSLVIDASEQGIWDWNVLTNEVYFSPQWKNQIGYKDSELENVFDTWVDHLHPDERESKVLAVQEYLKNPIEHFSIEFRFRHKDGSYRWLHNKASSVLNEKGEVVRMFGAHTDVTEKKKAELELAHFNELMRYIIEHTQSSIAVHDTDMNYIYVSNSYYSDLRIKESNIIGRNHYDVFPDLPHYLKDVHQRALNGEVISAEEEQLVHKDGSIDWANWQCRPWYKEDHSIGGIIIYIEVITDRRKAEINLRESEEKFRSLVLSLQDIVYTLDTEQRHTGVYGEWIEKSGLTPEYFIGKTAEEIFGKEAALIHEEANQKALSGFNTFYEWSLPNDGEKQYFQTSVSPLRDSKGFICGIVGVARDITLLKSKEKELSDQNQFINTLLNAIPVAVFYKDNEGNYTGCNRVFSEILGKTSEEIRGKSVMDLWPGEMAEVYHKKDLELMQSGKHQTYEFMVKDKDGNQRPVIFAKDVLFDADRNVVGLVGAFLDISAQKKLIEELEQRNFFIQTVLDNLPIGISLNEIDTGELKYNNNKFSEIYGWSNESVSDVKSFFENVYPDPVYRSEIESMIMNDLMSGDKERMKWENIRIRTQNNEEKFVSAANIPIIEQNLMVSTVQDVTLRKIAEDKIKENQERLKLLIELAPDAFLHGDKSGNLIGANNKAIEMFGYLKEELLSMNIQNLFPTEVLESKPLRYDLLKAGETLKIERQIRRKDGELIYVEMNSRAMPDGTYQSFIRDITDRKKAEADLERTKIQLIETIMQSPLPMVLASADDFKIKVINKATENFLLINSNDYLEKSLMEVDIVWQEYTPEGEKVEAFDLPLPRALQGVVTRSKEMRLERRDGSSVWQLASGAPIFDSQGKLIAGLLVIQDITDRKKAEEELQIKNWAIESSINAIAIADLAGKLTYVNSSFLRFWGFKEYEEVIGRSSIDFWQYPEEPSKVIESLQNQGYWRGEMIARRSDGSVFDAEVSASMIRDQHGNPLCTQASFIDITERKRAEEILKESEDRFSKAIDGTGAGLWDWDIINDKVYFSPQWKNMLGYKDNEVENDFSGWKKLWHPEDAATIENAVNDYIQMKTTVYEVVHRLKHKDGSWHWILTRGDIQRDTAGRPIRWVGTNIDITDRMRAEEELKLAQKNLAEKEAQYRLIAENSEDLIYVYSLIPEPHYEYISPSCFQLTGYLPEEGYADPFAYQKFLINPLDLERFTHFLLNSDQPTTIEEEWKKKDGTHIWVEQSIRRNYDEKGNLISFQSTVRDITERKRAEQELESAMNMLQTALDQSPSGILIANAPDVTIRWANEEALGIRGKSELPLTGIDVSNHSISWQTFRLDGTPMPSEELPLSRAILKGETVRNEEVIIRHASGEDRYVSSNSAPIRNSAGEITSGIVVFHDITERKKIENALKESEELHRKLLMTVPDLIIRTDLQGNIVFINESAFPALGFIPLEQLHGKNMLSFIAEEDLPKALENTKLMFERPLGPKEYRLKFENGLEILAEVNGDIILDANDNPSGMVYVVRDITQRKQMEAALLESERKFRTLFETMPNGYYRSTPEGYFVDANPAFIHMLGYDSLEEIKKLHIPTELFVESSEREEILNTNPEFVEQVESYRLKTKNGDIIWIEDNARYIRDEKGNIIFNEGICKDVTERKKAVQLLRTAVNNLNKSQEVAHLGNWMLDLATMKMTGSDEAMKMWEMEPGSEVDFKSVVDKIHPDDIHDASKLLNRLIEQGEPYSIEIRVYVNDKKDMRHILSMGELVRDELGKPKSVFGINQDITARKEAETALIQSEERFSKAFQSSPAPLFISEIGVGKILDVNERWINMIGYSKEESIGRTSKELGIWVNPEIRDLAVEQLKKNGFFKNIQVQFITRNKEYRDAYWSAEKISLSGKEVMLSLVFDYTEQKKIEEALKQSEEKMKSIFRVAPIGIGLVTNRIFAEVNDHVCSMTGYSREELIGESSRILYPSDEESNYVGREKYKQIEEKGTGTVETRWKTKDGRILDILLSSTPIVNTEITAGVTFTALDITERKSAENQIKKNLEEKEVLLKEIHHRVKNNLQIISSLLFLQSQSIQDKKYQDVFRDSQTRVRSIALVHEKLYQTEDLSQIDFAEYIKNLSEYIRKSYRLYKGEVNVIFNLESILIPINMAVPLGLILNELITNAFKYAFPDGDFDENNKFIEISLKIAQNEYYELKVSDNGIGLPENFDPNAGKSLGLKLVTNLVRQVEGELTFNRKNYTSFSILFKRGKNF